MATILGQRCTVFLDEDGIQRFKIDSSIDAVLAGDLPLYGTSPFTSNVFVHRVILSADPKSDTFLRVANVADLTTLSLGRELAVGLGQSLYLSTEFSVIYDDIATASTAKRLIQQRVDNLIADWHSYNEQFLAPLSVPPDLSNITLPLTSSLEDERKDTYAAAHIELLTAKADSAVAAVTAAATIAAAAAANEASATAIADSQQCSQLLGQFTGAKNAIDAYRSFVNILAPDIQTFADASLVFSDASSAFQSANATFNGQVSAYIALGSSPGAGPLATFTFQQAEWAAAVLTWNNAVTAWNAIRGVFDAPGLNSAIAAEALNGQPAMTTLSTDMAVACTTKISKVTLAASKKTAADKAAADAATAKKAADVAQSAALIADTTTYLSAKELCPDLEPTVP